MDTLTSAPALERAAPRTPTLRADTRSVVRRREWWPFACLATDGAMLLLAWAATDLGSLLAGAQPLSVAAGAWFGAIALALFYRNGLYASPLRLRLVDDIRSLAVATTVTAMVFLAVGAIIGREQPVDEVLRLWAFATVYAAAGRAALYWSRALSRRDGEGLRPTLIVGAGRVGRLTAKRLLAWPEYGLAPVGYLDKEPRPTFDEAGLPVLGASWDLDRIVAEHGIEQVIVSFSTAPNEVLLRLVRRCDELGVDVATVPRLYETTTTRLAVDHLGGLPLVHLRPTDPSGWQFAVKYAADRILAATALLVLLPVLAAVAAGVRISMGRPILFRQARVGLDGRRFEILKFRSMRPAALGEASAADSEADEQHESRLTTLGAFLRRTSLDELPQLWNVVRGDMSLVGPRPERPELVGPFARSVYRYAERHRVKSGITGWAQVHGLGRGPDRFGHVSLGERVEWDNYYIENWSLWLDVKILLMTTLAVLRFGQAE